MRSRSAVSFSIVLATVSLVMSGCSSDARSPSTEREGTLLVADTVFDGGAFHEDHSVLVVGDTITAVGPTAELRPHAAETIDMGDATLLPGFIDLHVHTGAIGDYVALVDEGVTTVRDLASPEYVLPFPDSAPLEVVAAGPIVTVPGGYPVPIHGRSIAAPINGPDEARANVRQLADKGAGVIKIAITRGSEEQWPTLSLQETEAIVQEAHEHGLEVTAHLDDVAGVRSVLKAGVDEWAHIPCHRMPSDLLQRAIANRVRVVATLDVRTARVDCSGPMSNAKAFVEAGGTLLYGSDLGNRGIPFGIDVEELELMMNAGLSLEEVLASATSRAGEALGAAPLGSLSPHAPADVIAVGGDVRNDLRTLEEPLFVMADGEVVVEAKDSASR